MFSVGDRIVYPMQGAGVIQDIEEKRILGESKQYYILRLPCSDINIMIPVDSGESIGIREVSTREEMEDVLRLLGDESTPMDSNWNRRYRENSRQKRQGKEAVYGRKKAFDGGKKNSCQRAYLIHGHKPG